MNYWKDLHILKNSTFNHSIICNSYFAVHPRQPAVEVRRTSTPSNSLHIPKSAIFTPPVLDLWIETSRLKYFYGEGVPEKVAWLNVSVDNLLVVQVLQP